MVCNATPVTIKNKKLYVVIFILISCFFSALSLQPQSRDVSIKSEELFSIPEENAILQTFFPLAENVQSITLFANHDATGKVKLYSNSDGTIYFEDIVEFQPGANQIKLDRLLDESSNHEFYMEITNVKGQLSLFQAEENNKDNHLIIEGGGGSNPLI